MKRLCSICARGGSKGVKNKNLRLINGKPLINYTILQAKKSGLFERIAVSSDSDEILEAAEKCGADLIIKRPADMASDSAAKLPSIIHCAQEAERLSGVRFDTFVDLDCTSPLRSVDDIKGSIALLETSNAANVITGSVARRSPYFNLVEVKSDGTLDVAKKLESTIVRRQDAPVCYDMNASIYVWTRSSLINGDKILNPKTKIYEMPESRSTDIDSEHDFNVVSFLITGRDDLK